MQEPGPSARYYNSFAQTAHGPVRPPSPRDDPIFGGEPDPAEFLDGQASDSLYAILNVDRTATTSEIKDKYRSLASTFHPDKQVDDARRQAAHTRFQAIQRAHEVLSDETMRTVYDLFGEEGLRTSWEVGPRVMSAKDLRSHFWSQDEMKRRMEAAALVDSKGDISIGVDARATLLRPSLIENRGQVDLSLRARMSYLQMTQVVMRHSHEMHVTENTQFVLSGAMAASKGKGGANFSGTLKHQFSPRLWVQYTQAVIPGLISTVKSTYTIDENTFVTGTAVAETMLAPPMLDMTLGRKLYPETTGFISYKTGIWTLGPWGRELASRIAVPSSLSIGATTARMDGTGWTTQVETGVAATALSVDWSTRLAGLRLKLGASVAGLGTGGLNVFADASTRVTEHTVAGANLMIPIGGGIVLKIYSDRLGQKIQLPIMLSLDNDPTIIFCTTVLPAAGYTLLHHFYLLPKKKARITSRIKDLRKQHADYLAQKRQEALDSVMVMERNVASKVQQERSRQGLVILDAKYGLSTAFSNKATREILDDEGLPVVIDVTVPLQALVQNSKLYVPGGRAKHNILGFYDPCMGETKKLRVRYLFRGIEHEVTVDDVGALRAPVHSHALD